MKDKIRQLELHQVWQSSTAARGIEHADGAGREEIGEAAQEDGGEQLHHGGDHQGATRGDEIHE